jgi:DNA polymerase-3 subunit alpha
MRHLGNVKIMHPDINISTDDFETDYKTNVIYWSILRVKFVGVAMVDFIVANRKRYGEFMDLEDFIKRMFRNKFKKYNSFDDEDNEDEYKRCPVNARAVKNLIMAGAFDRIEHIEAVTDRYGLLQQAAELLGFKIDEKLIPERLRDKHYFWSQQQINLTGIGNVDYERIFREERLPASMSSYSYLNLDALEGDALGGRKVGVCATIAECEEKSFKDKKTGDKKFYGKIVLSRT